MPDAGFIIDKDDLLGIVLTHAHEDHIGACTYMAKFKMQDVCNSFYCSTYFEKFKEKKIDVTSFRNSSLNSKITVILK